MNSVSDRQVAAFIDFVVDCLIGYLQGFIACIFLGISAILQTYGSGYLFGEQHPLAFSIGYFLMVAGLSYGWYLMLYLITYIFRWIHPLFHLVVYRIIWMGTMFIILLAIYQGDLYKVRPRVAHVHYGEQIRGSNYQSL